MARQPILSADAPTDEIARDILTMVNSAPDGLSFEQLVAGPPAHGRKQVSARLKTLQIEGLVYRDIESRKYRPASRKPSGESIQAVRVNLADVVEAPYNVNVMPPDKYALLKADMKVAGPEGTDPIHTCVLEGKKYTCDGAHRLRAAKELGWTYLYESFHPEIVREEQARLFNYRRDFERGDVDSFKLAASFKWFKDNGFTQRQIAEKFDVDESQVSKKLLLLGVVPEVRKQVLTTEGLSISHLETIASLPEAQQKEVVEDIQKEIHWNGPPTVRDVEEKVREAKQEAERDKKFAEAVAKAGFPTCPVDRCAKKARRHPYRDLPWATCESSVSQHVWNIDTGLTEAAERSKEAAEERKEQGLSLKKAPPVDYFRSPHTVKEYRDLFDKVAVSLLPLFDSVSHVSIFGETKDGKEVEVEFGHADWGGPNVSFRAKTPDAKYVFNIELKKYDAEHLKQYHSVVRGDYATGKKLEDLEKQAEELFRKYPSDLTRVKSAR